MDRPLNWKHCTALWLFMMGLRQDFWLWESPALVLGFLPIGLAYQAGYSLVAAGVLAALVRWAWPHELERLDGDGGPPEAPAERR